MIENEAKMAMRWFSRFALVAAALATIGCDRVTKHCATAALAGAPVRSYLLDTIRIAYVENPGGFLGLGATLPAIARTAIFTVATGLILLLLVLWAYRRGLDRWAAIGLSLFVAGGASNWIDRALRGSVVDFLNVGIGPVRTGVFNIADVAIVCGAGLFAIAELRSQCRSSSDADCRDTA